MGDGCVWVDHGDCLQGRQNLTPRSGRMRSSLKKMRESSSEALRQEEEKRRISHTGLGQATAAYVPQPRWYLTDTDLWGSARQRRPGEDHSPFSIKIHCRITTRTSRIIFRFPRQDMNMHTVLQAKGRWGDANPARLSPLLSYRIKLAIVSCTRSSRSRHA